MACARSRGSGNIVTIIPRITADVIAPPTPCTKRAPTSSSWLPARPHASDAATNRPRPLRNTSLRLTRSPRRPARRSSPPKGMRYALTTQARLDPENPRSLWIDGSATFTIVPSRMILSIPTHRTYSAGHRRSWADGEEAGEREGATAMSLTLPDHPVADDLGSQYFVGRR